MAIKFKVYSTPKPNGRAGARLTHARAISRGTYNLEKVCRLISERSAVSSAEVKSVLDSFAWVIEPSSNASSITQAKVSLTHLPG